MTANLWAALTDAVMITAFVAVMMIVIEYISVLTEGAFQKAVTRSRLWQYVAAVVLGSLPGCLGPFTVVALYTHRIVPIGAVIAAMIATSGDEAFIMLALFPATALWLMLGLAALGLAVGPLVDLMVGRAGEPCPRLVVHSGETCRCFPGRAILDQWRRPGTARAVLMSCMVVYVVVVATGLAGPPEWNWIRSTLLLVGVLGGFVASTVPDHFLQHHLWDHVVRKHVPRVFVWTLAVLVLVAVLGGLVDLESVIHENRWAVLGVAALLGIIPESGPHLIFVTMFYEGDIPLSILLASSIVQDGHGMLPLLAESRRDFVRVKAVNLAVGLGVGALLLSLGY
jgi:hypothetical protein